MNSFLNSLANSLVDFFLHPTFEFSVDSFGNSLVNSTAVFPTTFYHQGVGIPIYFLFSVLKHSVGNNMKTRSIKLLFIPVARPRIGKERTLSSTEHCGASLFKMHVQMQSASSFQGWLVCDLTWDRDTQ